MVNCWTAGQGDQHDQSMQAHLESSSSPRRRSHGKWWGRLLDFVAPSHSAPIASAALVITALALWSWRSVYQLLPGAFWRSWLLLAPDLVAALGVGLLVGTVLALLGRPTPKC